MSVGKASIARAVNAEKASKTETKTEVKEAEVKAAEKPSEVKDRRKHDEENSYVFADNSSDACSTDVRAGGYL